MAGIFDTFVFIPGNLAVRYSLGISGLLRPRGLSSVFVFTTIVWLVCSGRSATCGSVDVDLRYRRVFDCRSNFRSPFTLATSVERALDPANRVGTQCGPAAYGDCLNV